MSIVKLNNLVIQMVGNSRLPARQQKSLRQVIFDAGYSFSAAENPAEIFNSASWQELTAHIPKNDILQKLVDNALQKKSINGSNNAIETLIKIIPGGFSPQRISFETPEDELTDEELAVKEKELEQKIKERENAKLNSKDKTDSL